jgi:hypothetical protein
MLSCVAPTRRCDQDSDDRPLANPEPLVRLVPDILLGSKSAAETKVFRLLQSVDLGPEWIAFHSVNCSEHEYKQWCEMDFLLVGPPGFFVLEVKGGRIETTGGVWTYRDRYDRPHTSTEGPFVQARTAMYALRRLLTDRYGLPQVARDSTVFGFGVVFPDVPWEFDTVEMPRSLVADSGSCHSPSLFAGFLRRIFHYWAAKKSHVTELASAELKAVKNKIRPDIDVYPPFSTRLGGALHDMQRLTDEQYERMEIIEHNDRALITGGAGTGKTFLLIQCARRENAGGRKVSIVTESATLAAQLRLMESDREITITSIDKLATDRLCDVLFVDEGQDLMTMGDLDVLSASLEGGIEHGRWRWFMDANNQANVSGRFDQDANEYLTRGLPTGQPIRVPLSRNVRNTRQIISRVHDWTGADIGRAEWTGHGEPPTVTIFDDETDLAEKVSRSIAVLLDGDISLEQIGLILAADIPPSWLDRLPREIRMKCVPTDPTTVRAQMSGRLMWGRAKQFKGLERPVILAAGFRGGRYVAERASEFYVATTRGNYSLHVFCDRQLSEALGRRPGNDCTER